jgi:hypothetical protein
MTNLDKSAGIEYMQMVWKLLIADNYFEGWYLTTSPDNYFEGWYLTTSGKFQKIAPWATTSILP